MSKSTVKVTPSVTQDSEAIIHKEENNNSNPKLSISVSSDIIPEKSSSSPMKEKSDSKTIDSSKPVPSASQRKRNYNTSRMKSSESFFATTSDVFEIDGHVERLSNQLQKNYQSQSKKSNIWNAKRSTIKRFFMCSCIRAPSIFSSDEIYLYAKVGDLLLFREGTSFEQRYLSPEVMRGIKSSLDGKYIPKIRQIKMWNHIGIVVSLYGNDSETGLGEFTKYILYADDIGLRLRKLNEVTNSCVIAHDLCSLRPIQMKNSKKQQLYSQFVDNIEAVALLALNGKLLWSNFEQAERCKNNKNERSTIDEDILLILDNPIISQFHALFTQHMHKLSFSPSQEGIQEATRLFYSMLAVHQENEKVQEQNISGKSMSSDQQQKADVSIPLELIFKSLSVMNDDEGESKQGDQEFSMRLRNMLSGMDDDKDGKVSLDEFIDAFLQIPCDIIPVEFDLPSIAQGEMVACLLVSLGIFKENILTDKTFFHPQSFSSSSSGENKKVKNDSLLSKKANAVAKISKNMLNFPKKTKFKQDILLRIR